jgi:hypothetical protein
MDLNSRFEALKIALDQRPSIESRSCSQSPSAPYQCYERNQFTKLSSTRPDCSPYLPISVTELRLATMPADRRPLPTKSQPHRPQPDPSIGPRPPPPADKQESQDRQSGDSGKGAAGPRLQRPAWMLHHAAPSGPSASPPRRDATGARKGTNTARSNAPVLQHRRDPRAGPPSRGNRGPPTLSPQGSVRGACCGPRLSADNSAAGPPTPSPLRALECSSESDVEEAEHRAIMRRLDESAEWAGPNADPDRRAELLFV